MYTISLFILFLGLIHSATAQTYELCADEFIKGGRGSHLLANVNPKNKVTLKWFPVSALKVVYDELAGTFSLSGKLYPNSHNIPENRMDVNLVFSNPHEYEECFCASPELHGGTWLEPRYKHVQKQCTGENYLKHLDESDDDLLFCPKCEGNLCQDADKDRKKNGAPKPVYAQWKFFEDVEGTLDGPGAKIFRQEINDKFYPLPDGTGPPDTDICTVSVENLPLPQMSCSDFSDPENGYGYGVNAKNMECGMSFWFKCEEDEGITVHVADINLNIIPCPPTPSPTESPVTLLELCNCIIDESICVDNGGIYLPPRF